MKLVFFTNATIKMSQTNHFSDSDNNSLSPIINNQKQIFEIIDSIVSLESCLHHQFIPLGLKDNVLTLGMINPEDKNGYNFIYPIVTSLNYSLEILQLDDKTHQSILAAYLKKDLTDESDPDSKQTVVDIQSDLVKNSSSAVPRDVKDIPINPQNNLQTTNLHERATLIVDSVENAMSSFSPEIFSSEPQITSSDALGLTSYQLNTNSSHNHLLEVKAEHINDSIDNLSFLEPKQLWQELLARIVDGGIGRLYLERHPHHGRIIWSKDGILQSSLDKVEPTVFNHIIKEIKVVGRQPLTPIEKNKKVAIEKFYHGERILLRIEFFLNEYGEEITVQILRDKALKFYEQRQVKRMMEQALSLSQKLEKILKKMIFCSSSGELKKLSSLTSIFDNIQQQIALLEQKAKNPQE